MNNLLKNLDKFELRPQFWFGDCVRVVIEGDDEVSEGTIRGLDYVLHDYAAFTEPNLTDCYYCWKYRVQFQQGYMWFEDDDLIEQGNKPTIFVEGEEK